MLEAADTLGGGDAQQRADAARADPRRVLGRAPARGRHAVLAPVRPRRARADVALAGGPVRPSARRRRAAPRRGARSRRPPTGSGAATAGAGGSLFGPLAERFDDITADFLRPMLHVPDAPARAGALRRCCRRCRPRCWPALWSRRPRRRALFAGVAAHAFRPFAAPMSSAIGVTLGTAAHRYGWPVAEGGSAAISRAMVALLEEHGARVRDRRRGHARSTSSSDPTS